MKFIMITHTWFMDSKGFSEEIIEADCIKNAQLLADGKVNQRSSTFNKKEAIVYPYVEETATITRGQKLSWWERLTGKVA